MTGAVQKTCGQPRVFQHTGKRQEHGTHQLPFWARVVGSSRCLRLASAPPWERLPEISKSRKSLEMDLRTAIHRLGKISGWGGSPKIATDKRCEGLLNRICETQLSGRSASNIAYGLAKMKQRRRLGACSTEIFAVMQHLDVSAVRVAPEMIPQRKWQTRCRRTRHSGPFTRGEGAACVGCCHGARGSRDDTSGSGKHGVGVRDTGPFTRGEGADCVGCCHGARGSRDDTPGSGKHGVWAYAYAILSRSPGEKALIALGAATGARGSRDYTSGSGKDGMDVRDTGPFTRGEGAACVGCCRGARGSRHGTSGSGKYGVGVRDTGSGKHGVGVRGTGPFTRGEGVDCVGCCHGARGSRDERTGCGKHSVGVCSALCRLRCSASVLLFVSLRVRLPGQSYRGFRKGGTIHAVPCASSPLGFR
jgi:hypothetical protein